MRPYLKTLIATIAVLALALWLKPSAASAADVLQLPGVGIAVGDEQGGGVAVEIGGVGITVDPAASDEPIIQADVAPVVSGVTEPVGEVVAGVTTPLAPVVETAAEPVGETVEAVTTPLAPVVDPVGETVAGVVAPVAPVVEVVSAPVNEALAPVTEQVVTPVTEVVGQVTAPLEETLQPLDDALAPLVEQATPVVDVIAPATDVLAPLQPSTEPVGDLVEAVVPIDDGVLAPVLDPVRDVPPVTEKPAERPVATTPEAPVIGSDPTVVPVVPAAVIDDPVALPGTPVDPVEDVAVSSPHDRPIVVLPPSPRLVAVAGEVNDAIAPDQSAAPPAPAAAPVRHASTPADVIPAMAAPLGGAANSQPAMLIPRSAAPAAPALPLTPFAPATTASGSSGASSAGGGSPAAILAVALAALLVLGRALRRDWPLAIPSSISLGVPVPPG